MGRPRRRPHRKPWGELAGAIVAALVLTVVISILATLWVESGGNMSAPIDIGGRWGEGTLGTAVVAFGAVIVVLAVAISLSIRSLLRKGSRAGRGTGR